MELYFDTRVVPDGILVQSSGSDQISLLVTRIDDLTAVQANRDGAKASNEPQYFCEGIAA